MIHEWYHYLVNDLDCPKELCSLKTNLSTLSYDAPYLFPLSTFAQFLILRCPGRSMALGTRWYNICSSSVGSHFQQVDLLILSRTCCFVVARAV
jgi:hypothetical protein